MVYDDDLVPKCLDSLEYTDTNLWRKLEQGHTSLTNNFWDHKIVHCNLNFTTYCKNTDKYRGHKDLSKILDSNGN